LNGLGGRYILVDNTGEPLNGDTPVKSREMVAVAKSRQALLEHCFSPRSAVEHETVGKNLKARPWAALRGLCFCAGSPCLHPMGSDSPASSWLFVKPNFATFLVAGVRRALRGRLCLRLLSGAASKILSTGTLKSDRVQLDGVEAHWHPAYRHASFGRGQRKLDSLRYPRRPVCIPQRKALTAPG
jgi:hypothetical protein